MRLFLAAALAALALPALAQDAPADRDVEVEIDVDSTSADGRSVRIQIGPDDDGRLVIRGRGGDDGARTFRFEGPDLERLAPFRDLDRAPYADLFRGFLRGLGGQPGVSDETRERLDDLEAESRRLARRARDGDADAASRLDAVLGDLFEARADARRERADGLRDQAARLRDEADAIEAALRDRDARRADLIEARRAELLGEPAGDW